MSRVFSVSVIKTSSFKSTQWNKNLSSPRSSFWNVIEERQMSSSHNIFIVPCETSILTDFCRSFRNKYGLSSYLVKSLDPSRLWLLMSNGSTNRVKGLYSVPDQVRHRYVVLLDCWQQGVSTTLSVTNRNGQTPTTGHCWSCIWSPVKPSVSFVSVISCTLPSLSRLSVRCCFQVEQVRQCGSDIPIPFFARISTDPLP
jgi:hypothetical protein